MKYSFHPEAQKELNEYIDYYEECRADLGFEFAAEIYKTIQRIFGISERLAGFACRCQALPCQ